MERYSNSFQDVYGNALVGATVTVRVRATQALASLYTDDGVTPTAMPGVVTTDSVGEFYFYAANGRYDLTVSKLGVVTQTLGDVMLFDGPASSGSASVGYIQSGTGAVSRTVQARLRDLVSLLDFIPVAEHAAIAARTSTTDLTTYIQAALDAVNTDKRGGLYVPPGLYNTGSISWPATGNNIALVGAGSGYGYDTSSNPHTTFRARTGTTIVFNLVTGAANYRQGNYISDIEVDGNSIATVGIDVANANIIERVKVRRCSTAGIRLSNLTNSTHIKGCNLILNTGYGLLAEGTSTTTYSVEDTIIQQNTFGGIELEAGVHVYFKNVVSESNTRFGLQLYRPNTHANAFQNFVFDNCWFEDNGSAGGANNYTLSINAQTQNEANAPSRITFRHCRFNPSVATRRHMNLACAKWVTFENCAFDASTASDTLTLSSTAYFVAWIESANAPGFTGLSATQLDNAIAQGTRCYSHDRDIKRVVGAGSPAASFQNGWVNSDGGHLTAAYWFDREGNVCIEGSIRLGTIGSPAFTLPVGYRPLAYCLFPVESNNAYGMVSIITDGTVIPNIGSNVLFALNTVRFRTG